MYSRVIDRVKDEYKAIDTDLCADVLSILFHNTSERNIRLEQIRKKYNTEGPERIKNIFQTKTKKTKISEPDSELEIVESEPEPESEPETDIEPKLKRKPKENLIDFKYPEDDKMFSFVLKSLKIPDSRRSRIVTNDFNEIIRRLNELNFNRADQTKLRSYYFENLYEFLKCVREHLGSTTYKTLEKINTKDTFVKEALEYFTYLKSDILCIDEEIEVDLDEKMVGFINKLRNVTTYDVVRGTVVYKYCHDPRAYIKRETIETILLELYYMFDQ